ncbi:hypothetical protein [Rhizobium miluonense]|uniref:Uncharacterized protein n=1 Tax=Rhizobium miluonense TaxID=411945 RepID=A0A1C3XAE7_9HYPH|nr:hypothetical protein [Rhizobium miluonense]SCB49155.1 hypothetical protein GA0061102_107129 [Rhizobium miluonense]
MTKIEAKKTSITVRDTRTGKYVTVKGAGSLAGSTLTMKRNVDLTKPIAKQALREKRK